MTRENNSPRPMCEGDFLDLYGVTPAQVEAAIEENRGRVTRRLSEWGYGWAVDDVLCDVATELLAGGLRRWASYDATDRRPLGAFVNTLIGNRLGTWMNTERPKFRGGMTHAPQSRNRRRRRGGADAPSTDADGARARLRSEERAAAASRLCEEEDILSAGDQGSPTATPGDRASYCEWIIEDGETERTSDAYRRDMQALRIRVRRRWGHCAWDSLMRQCMTVRDPEERLQREIRHWLEAHHAGGDPDPADYPYIRRVLDRHREDLP